MAVGQDIALVGDKQLVKTLDALRNSVKNEVMRPAIREGAKIAKASAQQKCTSTRIRKLISTKIKTTKSGRNRGAVHAKVFVRNAESKKPRKNAKSKNSSNMPKIKSWGRLIDFSILGHFLEFGTRNHAPKPFMRPAVSENGTKIQNRITQRVRKELMKVVRKRRAAGKGLV